MQSYSHQSDTVLLSLGLYPKAQHTFSSLFYRDGGYSREDYIYSLPMRYTADRP